MHPALVALLIVLSVVVGATTEPTAAAFYAGVGATAFLMLAMMGWLGGDD